MEPRREARSPSPPTAGPAPTFERLVTARPALALFDLETSEIRLLSLFERAKHINPQYSPDGESLYFIADRRGFSNVYRTDLTTGEVFQITDIATGVSGITALSPALSVAAQTGLVMYSVFEAQNYNIYALAQDRGAGHLRQRRRAAGDDPGGRRGRGRHPPARGRPRPQRRAEVPRRQRHGPARHAGLPRRAVLGPPRARLRDQPSVGAGYDPYYGFGVGGGVAMRFSDVLGNNILGVTVQANGSFKDIGGQVFYLNQRQRLNWGGTVSHIPFLQIGYAGNPDIPGAGEPGECDANGDGRLDPGASPQCNFPVTRIYQRIYLSQAAAIAAYPLSQTRRFEGNLGYRRIGYGFEYDAVVVDGNSVQGDRRSLDPERFGFRSDALHLAEAGLAYVGDYSFFGFTSPVRGGRYRLGVDGTAGSLNYATVTADYRRYLFVKPVTFAARVLHYGRYGPDSESGDLFPLFLGYGTLVRGYRAGSFETQTEFGALEDQLYGSRIGVASAEVRLPFFGTSEFGLINFPYFPTELTLFADAGMAWGKTGDRFSFIDPATGTANTLGNKFADQTPLFSAGGAARVNILGALILEFYYAFPFSRDDGNVREPHRAGASSA